MPNFTHLLAGTSMIETWPKTVPCDKPSFESPNCSHLIVFLPLAPAWQPAPHTHSTSSQSCITHSTSLVPTLGIWSPVPQDHLDHPTMALYPAASSYSRGRVWWRAKTSLNSFCPLATHFTLALDYNFTPGGNRPDLPWSTWIAGVRPLGSECEENRQAAHDKLNLAFQTFCDIQLLLPLWPFRDSMPHGCNILDLRKDGSAHTLFFGLCKDHSLHFNEFLQISVTACGSWDPLGLFHGSQCICWYLSLVKFLGSNWMSRSCWKVAWVVCEPSVGGAGVERVLSPYQLHLIIHNCTWDFRTKHHVCYCFLLWLWGNCPLDLIHFSGTSRIQILWNFSRKVPRNCPFQSRNCGTFLEKFHKIHALH